MYERIRNLREDHDLKQRQLAEILNYSQRVYSNYEHGDIDIPTEILIKLSDYYGVSIDYILGQTDNPKRGWKCAHYHNSQAAVAAVFFIEHKKRKRERTNTAWISFIHTQQMKETGRAQRQCH